MGLDTTPGTGVGLENVGISGVCGVRPAWPRVMSYPALMEKLATGGPTGGATMAGTDGGPGLMEEARGDTEGEVAGGKGELLLKWAERVEGGGNWEDKDGGGARGLLNGGRGG